MFTIAVICPKGGVGKTTIVTHLTHELARLTKKQTVLIDADPQTSSSSWADDRPEEGNIPVVATPSARLKKVIETAAKQKIDYAIVDTGRDGEGIARDAAEVANLVIIPTTPAKKDFRELPKTIRLVQFSSKAPIAVVVNKIRPNSHTYIHLSAAITKAHPEIEVAPPYLELLADFERADSASKTVWEHNPTGDAAKQITELAKWIIKQSK